MKALLVGLAALTIFKAHADETIVRLSDSNISYVKIIPADCERSSVFAAVGVQLKSGMNLRFKYPDGGSYLECETRASVMNAQARNLARMIGRIQGGDIDFRLHEGKIVCTKNVGYALYNSADQSAYDFETKQTVVVCPKSNL